MFSGILHADGADTPFENSYSGKPLGGFTLQINQPSLNLEYMVHIEGSGDTDWHKSGDFVGSLDPSTHIEGIAFRLTGSEASYYNLLYTLRVNGQTLKGKNGEYVGTRGKNGRVEGIQLSLVGYPSVSGVVCLGGQDRLFSNSSFAGDLYKCFEGFRLQSHGLIGADIEYMAHIENVGDTNWHKSGEYVGTRGESKHIEGIAVRLFGPEASSYEVYYDVLAEGLGRRVNWIGKDGQFVGTREQNRPVQGIQVTIRKK
eukprot:TRINITY_DN1332_c0_g1_i1.p1 TRINITY_DN1332_c0_g1~~TRINITY_DN1332_c0_g1_i1.p1  ORF type:complete len:266 (-),score=48.01 TRINITY_DN1332_c0_g1_i1:36-806(-)